MTAMTGNLSTFSISHNYGGSICKYTVIYTFNKQIKKYFSLFFIYTVNKSGKRIF